MGIPLNRLNEIIRGRRGVSADTALRLARLLDTSAKPRGDSVTTVQPRRPRLDRAPSQPTPKRWLGFVVQVCPACGGTVARRRARSAYGTLSARLSVLLVSRASGSAPYASATAIVVGAVERA
jgi:hypothetical protein